MCGIAGILSNGKLKVELAVLKKMTDSIAHRGPDGEGQWTDDSQRIGLAHRRLSILDLSSNGAQPMHFNKRYSIVFNGEIYNYIELREQLKKRGYTFHSDSDTEVILAAYDLYKENCLSYFDGMFAIAIWDSLEETLFCARDRFGEKPFYYHLDEEGNFYFASEMKALWSIGVKRDINNNMLFLYLAHDVIENPKVKSETFFKNIFKLEASHYIIVKNGKLAKTQYWDVKISDENYHLTEAQVIEKFQELLFHSTKIRMRSDVPVGSSLSGGIDSSSLVTIINKILKSGNQHCFSARFKNFSKDEGIYIEKLIEHLNVTQHNAWNESDSLSDIFDKIMFHQEEPFQSGSIVAQWSVYELARREKVLVLLDGQGADEYLGGYFNDAIPFLREQKLKGGNGYDKFSEDLHYRHGITVKNDFQFYLQTYFPQLKYRSTEFTRKYRMVDYKRFLSEEFYREFNNTESPFSSFNTLKETFKYELMNYGLEKLLRFADRNAMAHSIEVRLPYLSHELVEFVFTLKSEMFYKDGWTKYLLRKAMDGNLNNEICWRRDKIGFDSPYMEWLKEDQIVQRVNQGRRKLEQNGIISKNSNISDWKSLIVDAFIN